LCSSASFKLSTLDCAITAACLLCSTAIRGDIRATLCCCGFGLPWSHSVECILLHNFNAQP